MDQDNYNALEKEYRLYQGKVETAHERMGKDIKKLNQRLEDEEK